MPAAPATQPSPTSGIRRTSSRRPTWAAMRASSEGTASPVTVAVTTRSTSDGVRSAALSASTSAREPSSTACSKSPSPAYSSRGRTVCRRSTPALAWKRRSIDRSRLRSEMNCPNASVISACGCEWGGSAPRTERILMSATSGCGGRRQVRCGPVWSVWSVWSAWSGQAAQQPARQPGVDTAVAEAELDERVEGVAVTAGGVDPGVDDAGRLRQPRRRPGVPQVGAQQGAYDAAVLGAGPRGPAGTHRPRRGATGRDAGGDRVVDPLAGHRVDQPGGVADEQDRAVGLVPPPAAQRQVVAAPVVAGAGGAGHEELELLEEQSAARRPAVAFAGQQLAVADVGHPVAA